MNPLLTGLLRKNSRWNVFLGLCHQYFGHLQASTGESSSSLCHLFFPDLGGLNHQPQKTLCHLLLPDHAPEIVPSTWLLSCTGLKARPMECEVGAEGKGKGKGKRGKGEVKERRGEGKGRKAKEMKGKDTKRKEQERTGKGRAGKGEVKQRKHKDRKRKGCRHEQEREAGGTRRRGELSCAIYWLHYQCCVTFHSGGAPCAGQFSFVVLEAE